MVGETWAVPLPALLASNESLIEVKQPLHERYTRAMFREEGEFVRQVTRALQAVGFEVRSEVRIRGRWRLDLVATKDKVTKGIEVKLDRRGLLDDLV